MILGVQELVDLAQAAGTGGDPQAAAAVALAESGGDAAAVGQNADQWRSRDRGLWQINDHWHPEVSDACAFDPGCAARAAYAISNGWTDFSAWATYQSDAYRQFLPSTATAEQQPPAGRSLYGQSVVGEMLTSPWFPGTWEVTQGWGPTDYAGEPEGHGYQHWHAGVDVGVACGTTITLPAGISGTARSFDQENGYGTALIVLVDGGPGILLGHLRQRLVDDGEPLAAGDELAISNSTGNSTGCHVHFEIRPQDPKQQLGVARYGNDIDPSQWLTAGQPGTSAELFSATQDQGFGAAIQRGLQQIVAGFEVLMGAGLLVAGLVAAAYGMRGGTAAELGRDARRQARALARPRPEPRRRREPDTTPAGETRIRPDLQRRRPGPDIVSTTRRSARLDPSTGLPRRPRPAARPRPLVRIRSTSAERGRERELDDQLAARQAARRSRRR